VSFATNTHSQEDDVAEWVKCSYSRSEIDAAAAALVPWWKGEGKPEGLGEKFMIVENWRTSHGLPLNVFQAALHQRTKRIGSGIIVAQRLKRFPSVINKLVREPSMRLSQMHDLGGCRAILPNMIGLNSLYRMFHGSDAIESGTGIRYYNYIEHPKEDGYRGIHIVGRYYARSESRKAWNGHKIEIQLRTRLQHIFATAVETVTTFTRTPLKFGSGPPEWRRFFSLMGSALALREKTQPVAGTPKNENELILELRETTKKLKVRQKLRGWTNVLKQLPTQNIIKFKWILLVLDLTENTIKVTGYMDREEASKTIAEIEQLKRDDLDAVLVWVNHIRDLRAAYPNYYADTKEFITALDGVLRS
jgi:hypothetical protein